MGKVVEKVLEILQMQAENTVDMLDIMFSDRATSYRKARRSLLHGPPEFKTDWADWYRQRQAFYSLLNQLKRDGLIKKRTKGRLSPWSITRDGSAHLTRLKLRYERKKREGVKEVSLPKKQYAKSKKKGVVIVAFDIPERERSKRDWLRMCLVSFGFWRLQKSVWLGKMGVPEEFIRDLREQEMMGYVHIFSIGGRGTLVKKI